MVAPIPPVGEQVLVYYQPVAGGMEVKKYTPRRQWLEPCHDKLQCVRCGWDLRPGAVGDRARFNIPVPQTPKRLRLFCGQCCNDGVDEMERRTGCRGTVSGTGRVEGQPIVRARTRRAAPNRRGDPLVWGHVRRRVGAVA